MIDECEIPPLDLEDMSLGLSCILFYLFGGWNVTKVSILCGGQSLK